MKMVCIIFSPSLPPYKLSIEEIVALNNEEVARSIAAIHAELSPISAVMMKLNARMQTHKIFV